jgi:RNA-binding protein YhbY
MGTKSAAFGQQLRVATVIFPYARSLSTVYSHPVGYGTPQEIGRRCMSSTSADTDNFHPSLSSKEKKEKRVEAGRLVQEKRIVTIRAGKQGLTPAFLGDLFNTLQANELIKVKLATKGKEMKKEVAEMCVALDCVCVQNIGSMVILYREKGLAVPKQFRKEPI